MTSTAVPPARSTAGTGSRPGAASKMVLAAYVGGPLVAVAVGVPVALATGWVSWAALAVLAVGYVVSVHGITIGYHRLFTHRAFKANRPLKIALAVAGSLAVEGRLADWVADHRRHHKYSDRDGDPHSPWFHGPGAWGLAKGLWHAHVGWLFTHDGTDVAKFAPDIVADRDLDRVSRWWPALAAASLLAPPLAAWAIAGWVAGLQMLLWGSLIRIALVHHVTWSVNSVCHVWGNRPFQSRDRSANVAWLALASGGESWHSYHHADPTSARHGVLPRQVDTSAVCIRVFERLGWARDVRWPSHERVAGRRALDDAGC